MLSTITKANSPETRAMRCPSIVIHIFGDPLKCWWSEFRYYCCYCYCYGCYCYCYHCYYCYLL